MSALHTNANNPFRQPSPPQQRDEWEDWEDDGKPDTTIVDDGPLIDLGGHNQQPFSSQSDGRKSLQRTSVQRPLFRIKSKGRQKAKIAKAGITLDTDVSRFRQAQPTLQTRAARFADADALKALEGSPNSASVGSFSWLRRKANDISKSPKRSAKDPESGLSPESRPIVIGIALPEDNVSEHQVSPQTAVIDTPVALKHYNQRLAAQRTGSSTLTPEQQRSVWSPDTEASESPHIPRPASSIYSQPSMYGGIPSSSNVPPVPALPATYKFQQTQASASRDQDDDDSGTPCTLFEEDGSPLAARKSLKQTAPITPQESGAKSNGWWDTMTWSSQTNPFRPQQTGESSSSANPFRQMAQQTGASSSSAAPQEWWHGVDEKKRPSARTGLTIATPAALSQQSTVASSSRQAPESHSEKARILLEENHAPSDEPPPYSPPKALNDVKYGVVLPTSRFNNQPLPSPGPISPGLTGAMGPQGAISMSNIPLTPRSMPAARLPDRPIGTYVTHDQFREAPGTNNRVERNRRRHEKEEFVARKVGGFWRGRGVMSADGCFGRTGREGRQRRRVCFGICAGIIAAIILIVVLAVVLTRKSLADQPSSPRPGSSPGSPPDSSTEAPVDTVWLNLTDFPPMPTGVLTVSGPNNSETVDGCVENNAKTLWSCAVPKDQQNPDDLYEPNQPEFIFQIQYDNNSRALWNLTDEGEQPQGSARIKRDLDLTPAKRAFSSAVARAAAFVRRGLVYDTGFSPIPEPPKYAEMFFLGNTTDNIKSDKKAGEPTPFFISLLSSTDAAVGPDMLQDRGIGDGLGSAPENGTSGGFNITDILPAPEMKADGTPAPARLFPMPSQQPVRLYDRGLPTEHYGFYTYFNKTVYVFNIENNLAASRDTDGGSALKDAHSVIYWSQTRFLVEIWTRKGDSTELLGNGTAPGTDGTTVHAKPGTMPYPVTITEDFHGGDKNDKGTWYWNFRDDKTVDTSNAALIDVDLEFEGSSINPRNAATLSLGGVDGGTGGCRCVWENFADKP